jgi:ferredoxin
VDAKSDALLLHVLIMESAGETGDQLPEREDKKLRGNHRHGSRFTREARFPNRLKGHSLSPDGIMPKTKEGDELKFLRARLRMISQRLDEVKRMLADQGEQIAQKPKTVAVVDEEECTGCGLCYEICPVGAVSMNLTARIDASKCTVCLACVKQCPQGAIAIRYPDR